jgi:hypothetical protein
MLWPLLGWLELTPARWLWAATTVAALAWLVYVIARESGMETLLERMFVALLPLSMYATGAAIGNGQLIVHLLPALLAGLLLLSKRPCRWPGELLAAALGLGALVKPSVSVPFFWIVLFVSGRLRPVLLVTAGYVALTLFAASFQALGVLSLIQGWLVNASAVAVRGGHANLHIWLAAVGLKAWLLPASLPVLVALGCWTYRYRYADLWLLLGVTAIVARLWAKHWWFDDLLILLPMVALCRIAKRRFATDRSGLVAGTLLAITLLVMLAPGGLYLLPPPWNTLYVIGQITLWIAVLIFLLVQAWQEEKPPDGLMHASSV